MLWIQADDLLRAGTRTGRPGGQRIGVLLALIAAFGIVYGAAMGTYSGGGGHVRGWQMLYSGLKVPLLLLATFALSLPSYYVMNSLMGLRDDFGQALRALLATQAGLTIVLAAFAPFTLLWYASVLDYDAAVLFNTLAFGLASMAGQTLLRRFYRPLIARDRRHLILLRMWLVIYAFVGIQMGWLLRPFIGDPGQATHFFRSDGWGNAYVILLQKIWEAVGR